MSMRTWLKAFYPITARDYVFEYVPLLLVRHALRKWVGLRRKNLGKHYVSRPPIDVSTSSCVLCLWAETNGGCPGCPVYQYRRNHSCIQQRKGEHSSGPWGSWAVNSDPEPMIATLQQTIEWMKQGNYCVVRGTNV